MKTFTEPKEIYRNVEIGDSVIYTNGHPHINKETRTGVIINIEYCYTCDDGVCQKKLFIEGYESHCFRYGVGIHGNIWAIKSLIKKENFLDEEDFNI